jgi:hypothetical protein
VIWPKNELVLLGLLEKISSGLGKYETPGNRLVTVLFESDDCFMYTLLKYKQLRFMDKLLYSWLYSSQGYICTPFTVRTLPHEI